MGIQVGDNFDHKSKKPLDARTSYATVAAMKAVTDANIYEGCIAYCEATDKYYKFKSSNTVDETTGKWRLYNEGGGGGASDLDDLGDVEITSPSDGQVLKYNSTTEKWENGSGGGGGDAIVNGYAYTQPFNPTGAMDYINWVKAHTDKTVNVSSESIFNGKTCNCFYMVLGPAAGYYLFSEYDFTLKTHWLTRSGTKIFNSSRYTTDAVNHPGYNSNGTFTYTNGITQANAVTIKGSSEVDCDYLADANKEAIVYASPNVSFDESSNAYKDNIVIIQNPLTFYSDSAHTTAITPETGKIYVDIPTGDTYEWNGTEYTKIGGGSSLDGLSDVEFTNPTNGQVVKYNSTSGKWENANDNSNSYTAGTGINISNQNEISTDNMQDGDMDDVITPLPTGGRQLVSGFTPVGTVISVMGTTAPTHYLACDGQVVNIADYPELAEYFEDQFGQVDKFGGNGTTTFGIPDLRGEFLRGTGTNSHTNQGSGAAVGVHQDATEHLNMIRTNQTRVNLYGDATDYTSNRDSDIGETTKGSKFTAETYVAGADTPIKYTARPTNTSVLYCIATKDIYLDPRNIYSTDEKVVGEWIDGKPLYQKTFSGVIPQTTDGTVSSVYFDMGCNVDTYTSLTGVISNTTAKSYFSIPRTFKNDNTFYEIMIVGNTNDRSDVNKNKTYVTNSRGIYSGFPVYVTAQYTKTTDTANS